MGWSQDFDVRFRRPAPLGGRSSNAHRFFGEVSVDWHDAAHTHESVFNIAWFSQQGKWILFD